MNKHVNLLQQRKLKNLYQKYGIRYLGLFGSSARGNETTQSDVDLLVDFNKTQTLFDLARIKLDLQELLGKKVDLTIKGGVKKILEPYINKDLITIYEED